MSFFKKGKVVEPVTLSLPPGYTFEFEVETGVPSDMWGKDYPMAVFDWDLFFNGEHVDEGAYNLFMNVKHIDQILFVFARKRAIKHNKTVETLVRFPYESTARHVLPQSMVIDSDVLLAYNHE